MSWYYLMCKEDKENKENKWYIIATHNNWEKFKEWGFHRVLGFSGQKYHVEFYDIKALWHDEVLHNKRKDAKLWRIALGIEKNFAKESATHKELLRRQAMERKKNRIFPKVGMVIPGPKIKWLACERCHRMYDYNCMPMERRQEYIVKENKNIFAIELLCRSGLGCNAKDGKRFLLTRPKKDGKINARGTTKHAYTIVYDKYTVHWRE